MASLDVATFRVVSSPLFRRWLVSFQALGGVDQVGVTAGADDLARAYLGISGILPVRAPTTYRFPEKYEEEAMDFSNVTATTGTRPSGAVITVRPLVLARYVSRSAAMRACAINTIAHEWVHTIPRMPSGDLYVDRGHAGSRAALASYTIGALAQCTYLALLPEYADLDVERCVEAVGTTTFNNVTTCADSWPATMRTAR